MRAPAWRQRDRDLEKELQFHLDQHVRDLMALDVEQKDLSGLKLSDSQPSRWPSS
jgi:hypothetical protein